MKITISIFRNLAIALLCLTIASCSKDDSVTPADPVEANIKKYETVWNDIMNKGNLDQFNETNFSSKVVFHMLPTDVVGIKDGRAYYSNFLTGFSGIQFEIKDIFGEGNKLTKHWVFKGKHTGEFFGIPATGKSVTLEGSTIVRMENGIIMEEQDFFDNLDLLTQLGVY
jgi:predicted ester cyclase